MPYANHNGVRIHYHTEGDGLPLVLMHGLTGSLEDWGENGYVEALNNDYSLILLDGRGHGASDKPHEVEAYDMKLRAGDIVAVLDELNISKAHYLGYSTGATIGFSIAKYYPDRVRSLILGAEHPYDNEEGRGEMHQLFSGGMETVVAALEEMDGPLPDAFKSRVLVNDLEALLAAIPNEQPGFSDVLPSMTMPCLVYVGEEDEEFTSAYSRLKQAVEQMPNVTFVTLPDVGHLKGFLRSDLALPHIKNFLAEVS